MVGWNAMSSEPLPIDYQSPARIRRHSPILAILLCLPGVFSFVLLVLGFQSGIPDWLGNFVGSVFWPALFLAISSAITSIILYARRLRERLPWYVLLNLVINICGLLFAILNFMAYS
jgi:hypothetical protein